MALVFHGGSLNPLIFSHDVLLYRVKSLLSAETSQHENITFANGDGMSVSRLAHRLLGDDLVLGKSIYTSVLFWWRATSCDQNLEWGKSNRRGTLVELTHIGLVQLFKTPFILVYVVAERYLRVDIVAEQKNFGMVLLTVLKLLIARVRLTLFRVGNLKRVSLIEP